VLTTLLENILFDVPDVKQESVVVDKDLVQKTLSDIVQDEDRSRYIL
ncbi:MAG: HslU--HslV peptidase ATPase subunit, partial [Calditrichaeota bacterium]